MDKNSLTYKLLRHAYERFFWLFGAYIFLSYLFLQVTNREIRIGLLFSTFMTLYFVFLKFRKLKEQQSNDQPQE